MLVTLAILLGGVLIGRTYFEWATRADLFYDADGDLAAAVRWLPDHVEPGKRIYIAAQHREHPTVLIANLPDVTWLGTDTLFRPVRNGVVIYPRSTPPLDDWAEWLQPYAMPDIPNGPDGRPAFEAYELNASVPLLDIDAPTDAVANSALTLLGSRANPIFPGAEGEVMLVWQVNHAPVVNDLSPILQVEDDLDHVLARSESSYIQTDRWLPGEILMQRMTVRIPPGTPPGDYALRMTWVARATERYTPFEDGAVWAQVGQVSVLPPVNFPTPQDLGIDTSQSVDLAPGVRLLNWHIDHSGSLRPGESLPLTLYWQGDGAQADVTFEALLRAADGTEVSLWRGQPTRGHYPPSLWREDEIVVDHALWPMPREQGAGSYRLLLYAADTVVELGPLEIAGIPRVFAAPPVDHQIETRLGDALELYGYKVTTDAELRIELIWQALAEVDTDYTVFVHVLDAGGNIVAQRDVMPLDNTYPTSLWAAGEYIADMHSFADLPPGTYRLRVGLYDQATGQRLSVGSSDDFIDLGIAEIVES